jgi:hypothetical protein
MLEFLEIIVSILIFVKPLGGLIQCTTVLPATSFYLFFDVIESTAPTKLPVAFAISSKAEGIHPWLSPC